MRTGRVIDDVLELALAIGETVEAVLEMLAAAANLALTVLDELLTPTPAERGEL